MKDIDIPMLLVWGAVVSVCGGIILFLAKVIGILYRSVI